MIFVTTGTHYLPFDRMLTIVNQFISKCHITEKVIVQSGTSQIKVNRAQQIPFVPYQDMTKYISKARLVITAAGPATIYQILQHHHYPPLLVPRLKQYGEHVSDHQLYFSKYLNQHKLVKLITSIEDMVKYSQMSRSKISPSSLFPSQQLITRLEKYISEES